MQNANESTYGNLYHTVCWKSIIAGAVTAAVTSLVLLILGSGIGFGALSLFGGDAETIASFTVKMAIWMIIMQWLSSAFGGYIAGRMRRKYEALHDDEIFFRDTAHGFLTWAVATLIIAITLTGVVGSIAIGGAKAATAVASTAAGAAAYEGSNKLSAQKEDAYDYEIDMMFRGASSNQSISAQDASLESGRIILNDLENDSFPEADREYLADLVVARAGVSREEAMARVDSMINTVTTAKQKALEVAEKARKASSAFAIFTALSMLIGAFIASVAAALGGCHRCLLPKS